MVALGATAELNDALRQYLNRLSDLLFGLAPWLNRINRREAVVKAGAMNAEIPFKVEDVRRTGQQVETIADVRAAPEQTALEPASDTFSLSNR